MACRRYNQDCGYGWMGSEGHGVETTATEPQAGGTQLMVRGTPHTSAKPATMPLLPARRSFLMVDGDFTFPDSTPRSLVELLSIAPPIRPYLQFNHTSPTHQSYTTISACSPLPIFRGFCRPCSCLWEPFFYRIGILHYPLRIHPFHMSPPLSPSPTFFFFFASIDFPRITCGVVRFGCVLNTFGWRPLNDRLTHRCISNLSALTLPVCM